MRAAAAERIAGDRPAGGAQPRRSPRLRTPDVPWQEPCGYDPQVADPSAELSDHPAAALAARWGSYLQHDRRRSAHTVRAYVATAHRLIGFLGGYRAETIGEGQLISLEPADLRAFLAHRR